MTRMKKEELNALIGKEVAITFQDGGIVIGTLGYTPEFDARYKFRKPKHYTCGNYDFKASHVARIYVRKETKA